MLSVDAPCNVATSLQLGDRCISQPYCIHNYRAASLTLKVLVMTIDALGHFETG